MNLREDELLTALRRMQVETGSLVCLGCGLEENCGAEGCRILREAQSRIEEQLRARATERGALLRDAERAVCADREEDYGAPRDNFRLTAELWEHYIRVRSVSPDAVVSILPEDVAAMMILLKVSRIATGGGKRDNWVDAAGYAAIGAELEGSVGHA